jgi:DNA-directed RNA polymerase
MPPPSSYGYQSMANLKSFENLNPIQLGGSLATLPQRYRTTGAGIGGDLHEMQSVFDACLQVGRIERAGVILQRLAKIDELSPEESLYLHNQYLRAAVEQIMMGPSQAATQRLHKWFELEIRMKNIPHDCETLAYMVKASLQSGPGQRERLVRRYMDMLDENAALQLLEAEVLTAHEINEITQIYPKYNFTQNMEEIEDLNDGAEYSDSSLTSTSEAPSSPNVRPVPQKGLGLTSLKKSLSLFSTLRDEGVVISSVSEEERRDIQMRIEADAVDSAIERWREESSQLTKMGLNTALQTKSLGARMWKWQASLEQYLREEMAQIDLAESAEKKTQQDKERCMYGPFLRMLPPEKLSAITILSTMTTLGALGADKGMPLATGIMTIAGSVEDESVIERLKRNNRKTIWPERSEKRRTVRIPELVKKKMRSRAPGSVAKYADSYLRSAEERNKLFAEESWPLSTRARVGAFLMSALIEVAKVPVALTHPETKQAVTQMQPAFFHSHQYKMGKKLGVVLANKVLVEQLKREPVHSLLAKHLPMLVTPEPWTRFSKGGFLAHPAKVMRIKQGDKDQRYYAEAAIGQGDMEQTFKGLDILGRQSWKINQAVFDVMLEAWNSGEAVASIPPESPTVEYPPEPQSSQDPLERRRWIKSVKLIGNQRTALHSQRCFQNFQLEIARALKNETFYFPHNIDFRGRAYPIPPYLNHMGADHCRGLLQFGEGRELGQTGLKWLKIHLSNVFGFDKASLSEREKFAMDHLDDIYDSALKPLDGKRWWLKAEDPWQCLAACMEIRNALEFSDPEKFVSSLPIHQDGTCNGLQHYAALGGDSWGARQVNLEPGDRPADVYSAVAQLVIESIDKDREKGSEYAILLEGKVSRKTVKQTVMTNVYGVTYVGAKAQVRKQLMSYPDLPNDENMNLGKLSSYIATKIFTALSTMFRGAHDIQFWLGECAQRISTSLSAEQLARLETEWPGLTANVQGAPANKAKQASSLNIDELLQFKSSVIWTNPLHMPVVQPYRNSKSKTIVTNMQRLNLSEPHRSDPVSKRKQLQGFPPNFIHSLDATHMLLSALRCDELGLSFAAVHDSFWTHAADVNTMNEVLRDAFIRIHTEDVIGRLAAEFAARYKGSMYLAKIKTKSPLYKKILAWRESHERTSERVPKAKKLPKINELMMECRRMKLLNSTNPDEVEKGKSMVTPASLFAEMAGEGYLEGDDGLQDIGGLGDISPREARLSADQQLVVGDESNIEVNNPLETGNGGPIEATDTDEAEERMGTFEKSLSQVNSIKEGVAEIWLPLTFPPVPKKVSIHWIYDESPC